MYKRTIWQDHVEGIQEGTDLNADNFNNIEAGTMEANALAALNSNYHRYVTDLARENQVVRCLAGVFTNDDWISLPTKDARNNTNYRVTVEISEVKPEGAKVGAVRVTSKALDGFFVNFDNPDIDEIHATFYVQGGII